MNTDMLILFIVGDAILLNWILNLWAFILILLKEDEKE